MVFPPRNLGLAEQWGRYVENYAVSTDSDLSLVTQEFHNMRRSSEAQDSVLANQIETLGKVLDGLNETQNRINDTVASDSWSGSVSGNAWGTLIDVDAPDWASFGIVIVGIDTISGPSNGWQGDLMVLTSASSPVTGDVNLSKDAARAVVAAGGSGGSMSNPRIVSLNSNRKVYIRPRGVRQSGTTATTYTFNAAHAVIWG